MEEMIRTALLLGDAIMHLTTTIKWTFEHNGDDSELTRPRETQEKWRWFAFLSSDESYNIQHSSLVGEAPFHISTNNANKE